MANLSKKEQKIKRQMSFEKKTIYAAIQKVSETNVNLSVEGFYEHTKAQYIVWQLADFDSQELELVSTSEENNTTSYVVEDQQFTGYVTITRDDIYNIRLYGSVINATVDIDDFEGGDFDAALDYIHANTPYEFCQLCAYAVKYKKTVETFDLYFKKALKRYTTHRSIQNKINQARTLLAPITKEDTAEQRYQGQDVAPVN